MEIVGTYSLRPLHRSLKLFGQCNMQAVDSRRDLRLDYHRGELRQPVPWKWSSSVSLSSTALRPKTFLLQLVGNVRAVVFPKFYTVSRYISHALRLPEKSMRHMAKTKAVLGCW